MASQPDPAPKKSFPANADAYVLKSEIGSGASATAYRAHCIPAETDVAIKVIDLETASTSMEEIRKELNVMSLCSHPNIVRYHVAFTHQHSLWLVMPLLRGSVRDIMKKTRPNGLDEISIATILKEVLKALEYLHRNAHVHRDVKGGNFLLGEDGRVYLGDFGVCGLLVEKGSRQKRNTFVGTPCWMAPEVIEQKQYDFTADIWSLGITAIELAKGSAPLSEFPPMKVVMMTLQNPPPSLDSIEETEDKRQRWSRSFREFVDSCLAKEPSKRPSASVLLNHRFIRNMGKKSEYLVANFLSLLPSPLVEEAAGIKVVESADKPSSKRWDFDVDEEPPRPPTPSVCDKKTKRGRFTLKEGVSGDEVEPEGVVQQRGRFALKSTPSARPHEGAPPPKDSLPPKNRNKKEGVAEKLSEHLQQLTESTMQLLKDVIDVQADIIPMSSSPELRNDDLVTQLKKQVEHLKTQLDEVMSENQKLKEENSRLRQQSS